MSAPNPSTPEATRTATEWRTTQRTYPAVRGTNQLAVTPEEFDEALQSYAEFIGRDMLAALQLDATADKLERDDPEQSQMAIASFREAAKEARKAVLAKVEKTA